MERRIFRCVRCGHEWRERPRWGGYVRDNHPARCPNHVCGALIRSVGTKGAQGVDAWVIDRFEKRPQLLRAYEIEDIRRILTRVEELLLALEPIVRRRVRQRLERR